MKTDALLTMLGKQIEELNTKVDGINKKVDTLEKKVATKQDISTIKKGIQTMQEDINKILQCVSTENAGEFPALKAKKNVKGSGRSNAAIAAKSN